MSAKVARDAFGNELERGQFVRIALNEAAVYGHITMVEAPSPVLSLADVRGGSGRAPAMKPGKMVITSEITMLYQEGAVIGQIIRVVEAEPKEKKALEKEVGAAVLETPPAEA